MLQLRKHPPAVALKHRRAVAHRRRREAEHHLLQLAQTLAN